MFQVSGASGQAIVFNICSQANKEAMVSRQDYVDSRWEPENDSKFLENLFPEDEKNY
jgi:hypothetical protein